MKGLLNLVKKNMVVVPPPDFFGPNIIALSTTESAGDMAINGERQTTMATNRLKILTAIGKDAKRVAFIDPAHDSDARFFSAARLKKTDRVAADAIVTEKEEKLTLAIAHADCYPMFLADPTQKIIGLIHAGRLPIQRGVISSTLSLLIQCECRLENVRIFFGPGICKSCYLFNEEMVRNELRNNGWDEFISEIPQPPNRKIDFYQLDLLGRAQRQLLEFTGGDGQKLQPSNICAAPQCTFEGPYFSHRKSMGSGVEPRNLSLIAFANK